MTESCASSSRTTARASRSVATTTAATCAGKRSARARSARAWAPWGGVSASTRRARARVSKSGFPSPPGDPLRTRRIIQGYSADPSSDRFGIRCQGIRLVCTGTPARPAFADLLRTPIMSIEVMLVDDHPIVLDGLSCLLRAEPDIEVVARCTDGGEALRLARNRHPDVIVLDLKMGGTDGLEVLRQVRSEALRSRVVIFTAAISEELLLQVMRLAVEGIVLKEMGSEFIVRAIRKVHAGGRWIETRSIGTALGHLLDGDARARPINELLSSREEAVVRLLMSGLRNQEIAERLFISEGTVKTHLHRIYEKLEVRSRLELVTYARTHGLG
ncbi:hypothetical protein CDA09_22525 [Azoarcus sp. DN11]|nr:hypothetical protein CDA09_22525 [Azoarcus sp. DN11]